MGYYFTTTTKEKGVYFTRLYYRKHKLAKKELLNFWIHAQKELPNEDKNEIEVLKEVDARMRKGE